MKHPQEDGQPQTWLLELLVFKFSKSLCKTHDVQHTFEEHDMHLRSMTYI
jgi:hypothetical protein